MRQCTILKQPVPGDFPCSANEGVQCVPRPSPTKCCVSKFMDCDGETDCPVRKNPAIMMIMIYIVL